MAEEQTSRLREFIRAMQTEGSDEQATFERFTSLVDQYGLTEAELDLLMSRDLEKVLAAIADPTIVPPVTVIGWWQK